MSRYVRMLFSPPPPPCSVFSAFRFFSDLGQVQRCLVVVIKVWETSSLCCYVTIDWRSSANWEVLLL